MLSRLLLACGLLAALLFVGADLVAGAQWKGYNFISKSISELSAIGAPTRAYAAPLFMTQSVVLAAFGVGVWGQAGQNTSLRVIASLLVANGIVGLAATAFFPMQAGIRPSPANAGVILGAAGVIFLVVAIGFGAAAFTNWFRVYSIATLIVFAVLTIVGVAAQSEPRIGLQERVMSYGMLLWVGLLALVLMTTETVAAHDSEPGLGHTG